MGNDIVNIKGIQRITGKKYFLTLPEVPTAPLGTSNLEIANTEFVTDAIGSITIPSAQQVFEEGRTVNLQSVDGDITFGLNSGISGNSGLEIFENGSTLFQENGDRISSVDVGVDTISFGTYISGSSGFIKADVNDTFRGGAMTIVSSNSSNSINPGNKGLTINTDVSLGINVLDTQDNVGLQGANYFGNNATANTYIQKKYADDALALKADITLVNTKITQNGDTFGGAPIIGSNDNFDVIFKRNNILTVSVTSSGLKFNQSARQSISNSNGTSEVSFQSSQGYQILTTPTGSAPGLSYYKAGAVTTNDLFRLEDSVGVKAGVRSDGRTYGANATVTNDFVTLGQLSKGLPNGTASLDSNGKVPLSQINDSLLGNVNFKGLYDGIIITSSPDSSLVGQPLPTAAIGNKGWYFISTSGFTNSGNTYATGDWIISNATQWDKVDNTDAVSSVNGKVGVVTITKTDVGLSDVDNTSDLNKPISNPTQTYVDNKVKQTITGGVTDSAPSQDAVFDALALKANNNEVVHYVGAETITGKKTFTNQDNTYGLIVLNNGLQDAPAISASTGMILNNFGPAGMIINNQDSFGGPSASNQVGLTVINDSTANFSKALQVSANNNTALDVSVFFDGVVGIDVNVANSGKAILANNLGGSTGKLFIGTKIGNEVFSVDSDGNVSGNSFIKAGGTSAEFLKADGSVDSNAYTTVTQLNNKFSQGGDSFGTTMQFGTNDNFGISFKNNGIQRYSMDNNGIGMFNGRSLYNLTSINDFTMTMTINGGVTMAHNINTASNPVLVVNNKHASATSDIIQFLSKDVLLSGVRNDGRAFGVNGSASNDFITLSQLTAGTGNVISQTITNGVTTSAPSQDAVFDALALKANIASPTFTGTVTIPSTGLTISSGSQSNVLRGDGTPRSRDLFVYSDAILPAGFSPVNTAIAASDNLTIIASKTQGQINNRIALASDNAVSGLTKVAYMTEAQYAAITPNADTSYFIEELVPDKLSNIVISAATYSISNISKRIIITLTGVNTTLTLPSITGGEGVEILVINRGDSSTINTNTGSNDIRTFSGGEENTYSIQPYSQVKFYNNGIKLEIVWEQITTP